MGHEIRIATAKKRAEAAAATLRRERERAKAAIDKVSKRLDPRIWAARRRLMDAAWALEVAELAPLGIIPGETIVMWKGKAYAVIRLGHSEFAVLTRVNRSNERMRHLNLKSLPWRRDEMTITDRKMALKP